MKRRSLFGAALGAMFGAKAQQPAKQPKKPTRAKGADWASVVVNGVTYSVPIWQ
jgi:hypothetical protein